MTKSQQAFEDFQSKGHPDRDTTDKMAEQFEAIVFHVWDSAWQARGAVDANICKQQSDSFEHGSGEARGADACEEAIRKVD